MRLSVLITYHNERDLLTNCLSSLQANSGLPDEILIYDDASIHPPEPYIPAGLSARVIRGEVNCGPATARNRLLEAATCEYVHFHDSDDTFRDTWYQEVTNCFRSSDVDAVFTEVAARKDGQPVSESVLGLAALDEDRDLIRFCIRGAMLVPSGTYRRQTIRSIGGYSTDLWQSEDYEFHIRLAASGLRYQLIQKPLVVINIRPESRSQNRLEVFTDQVKLFKQLAGVLSSAYHQELAEALARAGGVLYRLGEVNLARDAFHSAKQIAQPLFPGQRHMYRFLARRFGQEYAEFMGKCFRSSVPERLRRLRTS